MQQVIYLEREDGLPAIRDLLEGAQAEAVLLVVPKGYDTFHRLINLRILRRYAANLALDVALVTRDSRTRQLAKEEGIAVLSSVGRGRRRHRAIGLPRRSSAERAAAARVSSLAAGKSEMSYGDLLVVWSGRILGGLLFGLFLALVVGLAALVIPQARITLVPYREMAEVTLELRADPGAEKSSLSALTIPARIVEAELADTGEIATISKRDAPDAPAVGSITIVNQTATPLQISPGAVVRTSTGTTVRFRTVTTATLGASVGATTEAKIEALQPGPAGNVAAATISVVETPGLQGKIRVVNEKATSGGGVKLVGIVTRADMERLKAQLLQEMQQRAWQQLEAQLGELEFLPPESMTTEIIAEDYDQFLDAEADVLHLQMRILSTGTAVDTASANLLAFEALRERIPRTYQLESDDTDFRYSEDVRMDGRIVVFEMTASAPLVAEIDRHAVRSAVAGLTVEEAQAELAGLFALESLPVVKVEPEWIKRWKFLDRVPYLAFRTHVLVLE